MFKINDFWDIAAGSFLLILVYLLLTHGDQVNAILKTTANAINTGERTLQGR